MKKILSNSSPTFSFKPKAGTRFIIISTAHSGEHTGEQFRNKTTSSERSVDTPTSGEQAKGTVI